ncbi:MAG: hypothetical protein ACREQ9_08640 [Candidatus Binatia bacterium]
MKPALASHSFPDEIYPSERLERALATDRIARLRAALERLDDAQASAGPITYVAPWLDAAGIAAETVDFLFS